ncbi:MAG: hypothetical protein RMY34_30285 [Aulosira sp. DedQUE10]|nr:hypothetical protein [Aulosira sp. DedQUE10]
MYEPPDADKGKFYDKNLPKTMLTILFSIILLTFGYSTALVLVSYLDVNSIFTKIYPTSIPGIDNQLQCENSERIWRYNKCWDDKHNPLF